MENKEDFVKKTAEDMGGGYIAELQAQALYLSYKKFCEDKSTLSARGFIQDLSVALNNVDKLRELIKK